MTERNIQPFDEIALDAPLGWPIHDATGKVVKRLHLEPGMRRMALQVASSACGKMRIKREVLTSPTHSYHACDTRSLFVFFMRFHPSARLSLKKLGLLLGRDHTTVKSGLHGPRSFIQRIKRRPNGPDADRLRGINADLALFRPEFGAMDLRPYLYGDTGMPNCPLFPKDETGVAL